MMLFKLPDEPIPMLSTAPSPSLHDAEKLGVLPRELYFGLLSHGGTHSPAPESCHADALEFLRQQLEACAADPDPFPTDIDQLAEWIVQGSLQTGQRYQQYLQDRQDGAPRRYFSSKAHALNFIKSVAPTKMVDGSWLYGLIRRWKDPGFSALIDIYLEELGDGQEEDNHVAIYRKLIHAYGCEQWRTLDDEYFIQGATQLALSVHADQFLPEVIGFNLAYEQLPLHLLITAAELNELNIDPYYFTLHITIDNALSGHAVKSVDALRELLPHFAHQQDFMQRVIHGAKLNNAGLGSVGIIESFRLEDELIEIFRQKATIGQFMHHHHCRIAGRNLREWLSDGSQMPSLLQALQEHGWINRHQDPKNSRFWKLIDGGQGQMFGVFSPYEKQVLYDWIAGDALEHLPKRERLGEPWRIQKRQAKRQQAAGAGGPSSNIIRLAQPAPVPEIDEQHLFNQQLASLKDKEALMQFLGAWMSPALHHHPVGLAATRMFKAQWLG
ncbi:iron-containing redox enzyme family protein [Methylobacillus flagellatus]|uniref:iron-containing redox enzyme family protein n=1 Tax=Methylobacillus flagellatus TaxID=405 RepID=UPI002853A8FD|nr:iron-containing redox enzyme family protein [Methylobacillus flagellatus]MDR5171389.1 iron-containing redox enzyme family protein [Methylobacillus flagellatus]